MDRNQRAELQRLMVRLAAGDRTAFHPVFERLWPLLRQFAARLLPRDDADDAAQEALLKLFARASEFDPSRDVLPWAFGCVAYQCRTLIRKRQRRREDHEGAEDLEHRGSSPEETLTAQELETAAVQLLGSMAPQDQQTILAAIEENEGRGGATFRKRLQRALGRLRIAWSVKHGPH